MAAFSEITSFEHGSDVVHVNAQRSVLDGWSVSVTIVRPGDVGAGVVAQRLAVADAASYATPAEAIAEGTRMACAFLGGS